MAEEQTEQESFHELVLTNRYEVSPEAVWAAWTEPTQLAAWWHGPDWTTHDVVLEAQPRGRFSAKQQSPDGRMDIPFDGFYREAVPFERLVWTLSDADSPDEPARTAITVTLRPVAGGTEQEYRQTGVITEEHYQGLKAGNTLFFEQLGEHLRSAS